jgi:RNA polymerase sigma factor for flagellar operon FliA
VSHAPEPQIDEAAASDLWRRFHMSATPEARDTLIEFYLPLARIWAARCYALRADDTVPFADFIQYGRVGLVESIDRFDPGRGVAFSAFAGHRIRGSILNGLTHESELAARREAWRHRARDRVESVAGRPVEQLGNISFDEMVAMTLTLALGVLMEHEDGEPIDESIQGNPYAAAEVTQIRRKVHSLLQQIPERERAILTRHYYEHVEFQDIAREQSISKGRVSQLHSQALGRLRALLSGGPHINRKV